MIKPQNPKFLRPPRRIQLSPSARVLCLGLMLARPADLKPLMACEVGKDQDFGLKRNWLVVYPELPRLSGLGAVLLVSEPHAEINAGWICIGNRNTASPLTHTDWQQLASELAASRESFLNTSQEPVDATAASMEGFLLTPLLGCKARTSLDWCHAWAMIGQWSNFMVFPLPEKQTADKKAYQWPRHGHTGQLTDKMRSRIPSLVQPL